MIDFKNLKVKISNTYENFLVSLLKGDNFFPLVISLGKTPKSYQEFKDITLELIDNSKENKGYGYTIDFQKVNTKLFGEQLIPKRAIIDSELDYLKFLDREDEVLRFKEIIHRFSRKDKNIEDWIQKFPLKVVCNRDKWVDLMKVYDFFKNNPKPNCYIRELPIAVHTKFIEENKQIIRSLLDDVIECSYESREKLSFEERFNLKTPDLMIRLRILDERIRKKYNLITEDLCLPSGFISELNIDCEYVIIVENLMTFLTLPKVKGGIAFFGSGYGANNLKRIKWLKERNNLYWGDLDKDGFKILSQVRFHFGDSVSSILMDIDTICRFYEFIIKMPRFEFESLSYLTAEEEETYEYIYFNSIRLEQERISQEYVNDYLKRRGLKFIE